MGQPSVRPALPPRRDEPTAGPARHAASDPLAELARLIGHDETFGPIVRDSSRPEPRAEPPPRQAEEPPQSRAPLGPAQSEWDRDDGRSPHDPHGAAVDAPAYDASAHEPHGREAAATHVSDEVYAADGHARPDETAERPYNQDAAGEYYDGEEDYDQERDHADALPERRRRLAIVL